MGQKAARKRLRKAQRKKPFRKERKKRNRHRKGRRHCICGRPYGVEKRFRRSVNDSLTPLRGLSSRCPDGCECLLCDGGDMLPKALLGERFLDMY